MKYPLVAVWVLVALVAILFTPPPCAAQGAPPAVPQTVQAAGKSQPRGTHVVVTWQICPLAQGYRVYRDGQFEAAGPFPVVANRALWIDYAVAPGETHAYAVSSVGPGGESAPSAAATALVPAGGGQVVYSDALQNGWQDWGWANQNYANTAPVQFARSIRVTAGPWQATYLHHAPFDTTPYVALSLWVHGGPTGGQRLSVSALRSGVPQASVPLAPLPAGRWRQVLIPLSALGVANVPDMDGLWVQDASGTAQPTYYLDTISLTYPTLPAPSGLSAAPQWVTSCPTCGGMAMAHLVLAWGAVPGATGYVVRRDGVTVAPNVTGAGWTDMAVASGQTYAYTVAALGPGGPSLACPPVSATAPAPPPSAVTLTAPVNLSVQGTWLAAPTDVLSWSPVPGAASYNVYQYGTAIAQGVTGTTCTVPTGVFCYGMTYTVTAVDSMGMETLPSALATAQGQSDPALTPSWVPDPPSVPVNLVATPEWNAGAPRIHLVWQGWETAYTYNVYRDGVQVASGLWGLNYYDTTVAPGETHTYTVTGVNQPWTSPVESLPSVPVSATAPLAAPGGTPGVVQITGVQADDDSAVVSFAAVPGAADYRVYNTATPNTVKYSGGGLSIEMNGLDPAGATLVVEAVDKLGPFQTMDGKAGPGAMNMGVMHVGINGQGDPSDVPNVLAVSAPVPVTLTPRVLSGSQVFFDNFRGEQPLALQPLPPAPLGDFYGLSGQYSEYANDKWAFRNYGGDIADSAVFFMGNHFMDTLFDGGTPHTSDPMHNNDASLVMMPKSTADVSGGQVLHVTFEVDPHFDSRRWCEVQIAAVGDTLIEPGKVVTGAGPILSPTVSGTELRWQIDDQFHHLVLFQNVGTASSPSIQETDLVHLDWQGDYSDRFGACSRSGWTDGAGVSHPAFEGTAQDLDKRHRFDLYLSQTHYRLMENGTVCKDADFPAGATLPFSQCQVYFVHQIYHTANDRHEQVDYQPGNAYWYDYRPFSDERHWDACGQEVLPVFPALPAP